MIIISQSNKQTNKTGNTWIFLPFFLCVCVHGIQSCGFFTKYMKAPMKIYLSDVKVSTKTDEICIDYFHFAKKSDLDFKIQSHDFIVL